MAPEDFETIRMLFVVAKNAVQLIKALSDTVPLVVSQAMKQGARQARHRKDPDKH